MQALKRLFRSFFPKKEKPYVYEPGHTVIAEYAEFSGLPVAEVEKRINTYKSLTREEWSRVPGASFGEKAKSFYGESAYYICDILYANTSPEALSDKLDGFSPLLLKSIRETPGKRLLEFGGGTGVFCELAARMGKDVTYLDIPGKPYEFAKWRFEKHGLPVRMLLTRPGELDLREDFDVIFTDAVMEHLDDPYTPTAQLASRLAPGGTFVMLVDLSGEEEDMPMHKDVDAIRLHDVLEKAGLMNVYGRNQFASIWKRPA